MIDDIDFLLFLEFRLVDMLFYELLTVLSIYSIYIYIQGCHRTLKTLKTLNSLEFDRGALKTLKNLDFSKIFFVKPWNLKNIENV